jgi:uncharacterized membrane protein
VSPVIAADGAAVTDAGTPPRPVSPDRLPWLFLAFALPTVIFLSITMGPFQVADELSHCLRAVQVSQGQAVSDRFGGKVDAGIVAEGRLYQNMWFHPEVKQTVELAREAGQVRWLGNQAWGDFCNTAQYGPLLYIPQAIGFIFGQLIGLSVAQTMVLARLTNAFTACLVGFCALTICQRGRALMFTTLLLPMTLSEIGSAAQDALIIALSLLALAVASRLLTERRPARTEEFLLFAFVVVATTMARPSQIALVLLTPAFLGWRDPIMLRKVLLCLLVAVIVSWWSSIIDELMPIWPTGVSVSEQARLLSEHPFTLPAVILRSLAEDGGWYLKTVVGHLGWTDTEMPIWYYQVAAVVFASAVIAAGNRGPVLWPGLLGIAVFGGLLGTQFGALYLTWTPVGHPTVKGFQGRYLLPVLPVLAWATPQFHPPLRRITELAWYPVLLFPIVTIMTLPYVIMGRYYGSWCEMGEALNAFLLP